MRSASRRSFCVFLALVGVMAAPAPAASAADKVPDLRMGRLRNFYIDTSTIRNHRLLRYATLIVNLGTGPFEAHGSRPDGSTPTMTVSQRIFDDEGGYRDVPTTATMFYAGDGHNHWHLTDLETSDLKRLDGVKVGSFAKHGYRFYDNVAFRLALPGAPQSSVYRGCGTQTSLQVTAGLSVGWGDRYRASRAFQYVDITGLPSGRDRLFAPADDSNWVEEADGTNNATWTDLRIGRTTVTVIAQGPAA